MCSNKGLFRKQVQFKHGFTLIEMVVVVTVVALLISILLPAMSKARDVSDTAACLANLKQIATGWAAYSTDNKTYIVRAVSCRYIENANAPTSSPIYNKDSPAYNCDSAGWGSAGAGGYPAPYWLQSYVAPWDQDSQWNPPSLPLTSKVWYCQTNYRKGAKTCGTWGGTGMPGNYSFNGQYAHVDLNNSFSRPSHKNEPSNLKLSDLDSHNSQRPIIYDGILNSDPSPTVGAALSTAILDENGPYYAMVYMNPTATPSLNLPSHLSRWAHNGTWNIVWADGHASTNSPDSVWSGLFDNSYWGGWQTQSIWKSLGYTDTF